MLAVVFLLPVAFAGLILHAYRAARKREERGGPGFRPEGKLRWPEA